jgi:thiol-disulfide isomerase/thioredoxin
MKTANKIVMTIGGLVLLIASILKINQLLTEPILSKGFWESWEFFLIQIPLELGLAIWLLSGLFRKASWLIGLCAFFGFIFVTLQKGIVGAASCGCFGTVHVNPWITLTCIDIPLFLAFAIFRPKGEKLLPPPWPNLRYFLAIAIPTFIILPTIEYVLITNKPPMSTSTYEVLNTKNWIPNQSWPLLQYIDIGDRLKTGDWIVFMYHNDCPDCRMDVPKYEKFYGDLKGNNVDMAFIEMQPYEQGDKQLIPKESKVPWGQLSSVKTWYVETPVVVVLRDGLVLKAWQGYAPTFDELIEAAFAQ